MTGELPV